MIRSIFKDFKQGLVDSIRIDLFLELLCKNGKLRGIFFEIFKINLLIYVIPTLLFNVISHMTEIKKNESIVNIIYYPINIIGIFYYLLRHIDIVNIMGEYDQKATKKLDLPNLITLTIIISIYQFSIYFTIILINLIIYDRNKIVYFVVNFIILTIYHSFYLFNNMWHQKRIDIAHRISIYEKLWPYYMGFGTISTILYLNIHSPITLVSYNLYMIFAISIPFLVKEKVYDENNDYPRINLVIFSYILYTIYNSTKKICKFIR